MHIVGKRYGSYTDFSVVRHSYAAIARSTRLNPETVRVVIKRFVSNGYVARPSKYGGGKRSPVSPEMLKRLICEETLYNQRFLPLKRRINDIKKKFHVDLTFWQLRQLYKRNNVRYLQAKASMRLTE